MQKYPKPKNMLQKKWILLTGRGVPWVARDSVAHHASRWGPPGRDADALLGIAVAGRVRTAEAVRLRHPLDQAADPHPPLGPHSRLLFPQPGRPSLRTTAKDFFEKGLIWPIEWHQLTSEIMVRGGREGGTSNKISQLWKVWFEQMLS